MEDIYKRLMQLEEHHVRAVRGLEKLAYALEHVRAARAELDDLSEEANLNLTLSNLPEPCNRASSTSLPPRHPLPP
jgi:hypothetical protein